MEKAKNQVEAAFILGQDSIFNQARQIGQAELVGVGVRYIENYVANIRKVTAADVQRVARDYFSEDRRTVGILVPVPPKTKGTEPGEGKPSE
jgi:zinc protease